MHENLNGKTVHSNIDVISNCHPLYRPGADLGRVGALAEQGARGGGGDPQSGITGRCDPHHRHRASRESAVHMARRTQAPRAVWAAGLRQDHDALQCPPISAGHGGR